MHHFFCASVEATNPNNIENREMISGFFFELKIITFCVFWVENRASRDRRDVFENDMNIIKNII